MTSEEIIQRLLSEKKITVKEAMVILKDLAKIGLQEILPEKIIPYTWFEERQKRTNPYPYDNTVVMYGVTSPNGPWVNNTNGVNTSATSISDNIEDLTKKR